MLGRSCVGTTHTQAPAQRSCMTSSIHDCLLLLPMVQQCPSLQNKGQSLAETVKEGELCPDWTSHDWDSYLHACPTHSVERLPA